MKRNLFCMTIIFSLLIGICDIPQDTVQAASKNTMAKKKYATILSSKKAGDKFIDIGLDIGTEKFALLDINQDGVSELIFTPDGSRFQIVTYINGKLKGFGPGFSDKRKFFPNKHIVYSQIMRMGDDVYTYYKFTGNKMKIVAEKYGCDYMNAVTGKKKKNPTGYSFAPYAYKVNGKKVSKKKYQAYVKKLLFGTKKAKLKWHKNNATNRKRFL